MANTNEDEKQPGGDRPLMLSEFRRFGAQLGGVNFVAKMLLTEAILLDPDRREFAERFDAHIERSFDEGVEPSIDLSTTRELVREEMKAAARALLADAVATVEAWEVRKKKD